MTQFFINPQTVEFFFFIIIESNIISILKLSDNRFCVINIVISKYTLNSRVVEMIDCLILQGKRQVASC